MENEREKLENVVNFTEYRRRKVRCDGTENIEADRAEKVFQEVSYHLVMAARAIADQHGKRKKP
jgi:hypothetical protein